MTSYPTTTHTRGTTYSRAGLYALPAGTWTASAVVRKPDGTLIETLAVNFAALSTPDAAGNTHALSVLATAAQTALWPLAALLQDVLFTDASSTPVIVPAVTTVITVSAHTAPINEADNPLQTISPDLAPVLRGEQGPAGDAAAGAVTSVAGRTGAVTLAKGDVGLGSVDNTADASKPVSTAQAAADAAVQAAAAADATSKANAAAAAAVAALGTAAALNVPATGDAAAGEVVKGTDSRLIDARTPTAHTQAASTISDSTATGRAVLTATDAAAARTAIGAGTSSFDGAYASLSGKPTLGTAAATASTDYTPAAHVGAGGTAHANAVAAGAAGFMTGADKSKLDGIAAGATVAPTTTDALTEGSTNLYHTAARVRAAILTGLSTAAGTVVAATHTILEAIGFLQKQVSDNTTAIAGKQATLVSATNIKTINGNTLLGSGDLTVSGGGGTPGGSTTQVQYNNAGAFGGDAGLTYDSTNKALSVGGATVTTSAPVVNVAQTWNNAGVAFTGKLNNFTNTASAAGSLIEDWQIGGASYLALDKSGKILLKANGLSSAGAGLYVAGATTTGIGMDAGGNPTIFVHVSGSERLRWTSSNTRFYKLALSAAGDMGNDAVALWGTAAGQVEINNGTTGTYRDIKLRNHIGTGANVTGMAAKTADYTLTLNDHAATFDASGAARTATIPALSTVNPGQEYIVIKIDSSANALTLDGNAAETINGAANISTTTQWAALRVKANAGLTGWVTF